MLGEIGFVVNILLEIQASNLELQQIWRAGNIP